MKVFKIAALCAALAAAPIASAAAQEQFIPVPSFRVGNNAPVGIGFFGGVIDYMNLVNSKGGLNGVKLVWEECETEYNVTRGVECYERLKNARGGATIFEPVNTGTIYAITARSAEDKVPLSTLGYGRSDAANGAVFPYVFPLVTNYWNQAAGMIEYFGQAEGGLENLKGKKIVHLYHDSAYGKEPMPVFQALSERHGFELVTIPVTPPGNDQQAQWLQIRKLNPDYVILWSTDVMGTVGLRSAQRVGFPREKILGTWWAGTEADVVPAGNAATGYTAMAINSPGNFPVIEEIRSEVYAKGLGNLPDQSLIGSVYHKRGITAAILWTEAILKAQEKFGVGKVLTGEEMRWGLENLDVNEERQAELGVLDMFPPIKTSCENHEGSGAVKVQRWTGSEWEAVTPNWIKGDRELTDRLVQESSAKYAAENGITPGCLSQ